MCIESYAAKYLPDWNTDRRKRVIDQVKASRWDPEFLLSLDDRERVEVRSLLYSLDAAGWILVVADKYGVDPEPQKFATEAAAVLALERALRNFDAERTSKHTARVDGGVVLAVRPAWQGVTCDS